MQPREHGQHIRKNSYRYVYVVSECCPFINEDIRDFYSDSGQVLEVLDFKKTTIGDIASQHVKLGLINEGEVNSEVHMQSRNLFGFLRQNFENEPDGTSRVDESRGPIIARKSRESCENY